MTAEMMKAAADPARAWTAWIRAEAAATEATKVADRAWTAWMRADRARGARAPARAAEDRERAKDKRRR